MRRGVLGFALGVLAILFMVLLCQTAGQADGGFLPAKSIDRPPEMPRQRALIAFDGAVETLVVESTMQADEGENFVWLLPLPAPPTVIEANDPGILNTLEFCFGAKLKNSTYMHRGLTIYILLMAFLGTGSIYYKDPKIKRHFNFTFTLLLIIGGLISISVGSLGSSANVPVAVNVLRNEQIGNYQVVVLDARTASEINRWLGDHGFAGLPPGATSVVDEYLAEGWVILAAQLQRNETGLLSPHPLRVIFPTSQPIYPMRLTAMAGSTVDLSLFILSTIRFSHPDLHVVYSSSFVKEEPGNHSRMPLINNDDLYRLLGERGWLVRYHGKFSPRQMKQDLLFKMDASIGEHQDVIYTPGAVMWMALSWISVLLALALPTSALISRRREGFMRRAIPVIVGAALIMAVGIYAACPVTYTAKTFNRFYMIKHDYYESIRSDLIAIQKSNRDSPEMIETAVREMLASKHRNLLTGLPLVEEQSPGNYEFLDSPRKGLSLVLYDEYCRKQEWVIDNVSKMENDIKSDDENTP